MASIRSHILPIDEFDKSCGLVFLQKMAGMPDNCVRLALGTWNPLLEDAIAAPRDRIAVAERGEERPVES